ncbi:MAG: DUF3127 domain-containing protein [Bacteroidales bacterium]|nr:DUF3127 domain-containing protein [Bacteroidales bacterium]MBQ3617785.1 DUF3127 domain-containing protein [Bacteroidales bacterium]MDD6001379.1 DUF3127 domain-containing protein [Bacteroidales bacterium]
MALEVEGKLTHLLERRSGVSANGTNWTSQDFVIEIPGQYPQSAVFNVYGDRVQLDQYQIGENIKVSFDIRGREYQGKWYNTLNAWKIERIGATAPAAPQGAAPAGQTAPAGPAEQPQAEAEGDLPF